MTRIVKLTALVVVLSSCNGSRVEHPPAPAVSQAASAPEPAAADEKAIDGQTIYVPIYSHIYMRDKSRVINLAATLSIRNTDEKTPIRVTAVKYYGTHGTLVREYLAQPLLLAPMASVDYVVAEDDTTGGSGANFIVDWNSSVEVTKPVVEAVMISTALQQGISFVSAGRVIKEKKSSGS